VWSPLILSKLAYLVEVWNALLAQQTNQPLLAQGGENGLAEDSFESRLYTK
jgi:hypothetical protein